MIYALVFSAILFIAEIYVFSWLPLFFQILIIVFILYRVYTRRIETRVDMDSIKDSGLPTSEYLDLNSPENTVNHNKEQI